MRGDKATTARGSGLLLAAFSIAALLLLGAISPAAAPSASASGGNLTVGTASVVKEYPSKQKMTITMAGYDKTDVKLDGVKSNVKWTSSNAKVVKVEPTGKGSATATITAKETPGKATVKAKSGKKTLTCEVTVTGVLKKTLSITPLDVDGKSKSITQPKLLKGLKFKANSWKSSNPKCVKIDKSTGKLTPQATGESAITCQDSKNHRYTCTVKVTCPKITCKMLKSVPDSENGKFYTKFELANSCGQVLTLDKNPVWAYPTRETPLKDCVKLNAYNLQKRKYLKDEPLAVKSGKAKEPFKKTFAAVSTRQCPNGDRSYFCMTFKAGDKHYKAAFSTNSGTMFRCARA